MEESVKSGKEIVENFFNTIEDIPGVDKSIASMLVELYKTDKLTDVNVKNQLQILREKNVNKD